MPEPALPATPPNDHLTRRLLRRTIAGDRPLTALLEQLCTASVYVEKDDFRTSTSPDSDLWINEGFIWNPDDLHGSISGVGVPEIDEERNRAGASLHSRLFGWTPRKRCSVLASIRLDSLAGQCEVGFVDRNIVNTAAGAVLDKSTPTAPLAVDNLAVGVRNPADNAYFDLVTQGRRDNAVGAGTTDRRTEVGGDWMTIMVSCNEQAESHLWVNGASAAVERSGPVLSANLGLWLYTSSGLSIDFIQAWEERENLV